MSVSNFRLYIHRVPHHEDSLENLHATFVSKMQDLSGILSWRKLVAPALPDFGEELIADYEVSYPIRSLSLTGIYTYRGMAYSHGDEAFYDDKVVLAFNIDALLKQYQALLHHDLAPVIQAFDGYLARGFFANYATRYQSNHQGELDKLRLQGKVDINGRNNIFSIQPVQYWGGELCQRALGYGRDEVIRRLDGKVPRVVPLMDGVYVVFNDDPDLSFEDYCAYNDALKPVLGLA